MSARASALQLLTPTLELLPSYVQALRRGWCVAAADEELAAIGEDASAFVAALTDREARGSAITLPDGSQVQRLPGYRMWIWDGEFAGSIGLRWQRGTPDLPPQVLGVWDTRRGGWGRCCRTRAAKACLTSS